jgi:hypothetical protein
MGVALTVYGAAAWADNFESELQFGLGYRAGQLDWNIAGDSSGNNPDVLSELTWRDLQILDLELEAQGINGDGYYFRGSGHFGRVLAGENQDSDYAGDNRTLEFSRSINDIDGSNVWGFKLGVGKEIPFGAKQQKRIIPLIGYSYQVQDMRMTDGNQVVPNSGAFPGLNSSYETTWAGLWVGADLQFDLSGGAQLQASFEAHWPQFDAQANWNLRDDFTHPVSYEHEADAKGYVLALDWRKPLLAGRWVMGLSLDYEIWRTEAGKDTTYVTWYEDSVGNIVYCDPYCVGETQLNEVNWKSRSILLTFTRDL